MSLLHKTTQTFNSIRSFSGLYFLLLCLDDLDLLSEENMSVDHRLKLFLDVEVFEEEEEELHSFLKVCCTDGEEFSANRWEELKKLQ